MSQDAIWEHFQNEGLAAFSQASPRLEFLVRKLKRGERVLNIGVGSGELEHKAAAKGVEIWALDPSERAIGKLRASLLLGPRAQVGHGEAMPFPDGHFDTVVMTEVLEHLTDDIREMSLAEVRRVLRGGGRLMGTVPAREILEQSEVICPRCAHHFHRWGHQTSFDTGSLSRLLERFFVLESVQERFFNEWASAGWSRRLGGFLKKFLSWRGLGTYGEARNIFFIVRKRQ